MFNFIRAIQFGRRPWPVCYTRDITDYTQVEGHQDQYVWLVQKGLVTDDEFSFAWTPELNEQDCAHQFYSYSAHGKRLNPVAVLVPVNRRSKHTINQSIPFIIMYNNFNIYFIGDRSAECRKIFNTYSALYPNSQYIFDAEEKRITKQILQTIRTKFVWVINLRELPDKINFKFIPDQIAIYHFDKATLYPIEYFLGVDTQYIPQVDLQLL